MGQCTVLRGYLSDDPTQAKERNLGWGTEHFRFDRDQFLPNAYRLQWKI